MCTIGVYYTGCKFATGINDNANFATGTASAVDIGSKFAIGVNDTSGKFADGVTLLPKGVKK